MKLGSSVRMSDSVAARTPENSGAMSPSTKSSTSSAATGSAAAAMSATSSALARLQPTSTARAGRRSTTDENSTAREQVRQEGRLNVRAARAGSRCARRPAR